MNDEAQDKSRASFAGIVLLLRQLAQQLLENGNTAEARGIVDGLEAIEARTTGNLEEGEARFLQEILFELRLSVVRGPAGGGESGEPGDDDPPAEGPPESAGG